MNPLLEAAKKSAHHRNREDIKKESLSFHIGDLDVSLPNHMICRPIYSISYCHTEHQGLAQQKDCTSV